MVTKLESVAELAPNYPIAGPCIVLGGQPGRRKYKPDQAATICVVWGYEAHWLELTPRQWAKVKSGEALAVKGPGYHYEGRFFQDHWYFGCDELNEYELIVTYGNDGGTGYNGSLSADMVTEHPCGPKGKTKTGGR